MSHPLAYWLVCLRVVDPVKWETIVRLGMAKGIVSDRTIARWRRDLGISEGRGGARPNAGRKAR